MIHRFAAAGWSSYGPGAVGTEGAFGASFASRGAPGTGLVVTVFGDAVDEGLIVVESIEVIAGFVVVAEGKPRKRVAAGERTIVEREFPDFDLDEALKHPAQPQRPSREGAPQIYVRVTARAIEVGEKTVHVRVRAMATSAVAEQAVSIRTFEAGRRPLRTATAHPCASLQNRALRDLGGTDTRLALIVLDEDDDVAIPVARELFGGWVDACKDLGEGPGTLECFLEYPGGSKLRSVAESGFPDRGGWKSILSSLPHVYGFDAQRKSGTYGRPPALGGPTRPPTYGFALKRDHDDRRLGDDVVLPHILLWQRGGERDARDRLSELVRSVVGRCELVQAVVTQAETPPRLGINARTPYEEMCGVGGPGLIGQAWTTRWLRWCAERTWVGTSLSNRLDQQRAELEPFVVRRDAGVLELYAEDVDALERVLDPILPTASECEYRRAPVARPKVSG